MLPFWPTPTPTSVLPFQTTCRKQSNLPVMKWSTNKISNFCMQTFTKLVSKPHDLGEMSCDRASLARLCPKSVVLDLGVPVQCKMQKRFSLHLENGPHHMSTAPCAWSWAAFPPDWKMFSPYFVFGLQEKSTVGCQSSFSRFSVPPVLKGVVCNQIICPFLKITKFTYCTTI